LGRKASRSQGYDGRIGHAGFGRNSRSKTAEA
jgi:hypothetical protein